MVAYLEMVDCFPKLSFGLYPSQKDLAVILATFAFTMLGFEATMLTIFYALSNSNAFRKYKRMEFHDVFLWFCFFVATSLFFTYVFSILSFSNSYGVWSLRLAVAFTLNNFIQLFILVLIVFLLARRASS